MAKSATLTLRVSQELKEKLGRYAEQTQRSPSAVAERGLEAFLDREMEMQIAIDAALDDFERGRVVPHEEAMRQIQATIDRHRKTA